MKLSYLPDGREVETGPGETILQASLRAGIPHTHVCGGHARCSTCRVLILDGLERCDPRNELEQAMSDRLEFSPEIRLACQATVTGDVRLRRLVLDAEDVQLTSQLLPGQPAGTVGQERTIAIMFTDIRNFTPFAERLPAYDVIHVLNRYFFRMGQAVTRHGGTIDNYMGDGLMALFDHPTPDATALAAITAGLDMLKALAEWGPYLEGLYASSLEMRIGIHYGQAVVGAVGAHKRVTAIGDAVNLASRLEAANKQAGTHFLISEDTYRHVSTRIRVGQRLSLALPGKTGLHMVYEVVGLAEGTVLPEATQAY